MEGQSIDISYHCTLGPEAPLHSSNLCPSEHVFSSAGLTIAKDCARLALLKKIEIKKHCDIVATEKHVNKRIIIKILD